MRDYEYKVIRFLIFISILFLNYHILILLTSYVAPEGFLEGVKQIGGFFINLAGLHTLFAFLTFIYSRMYLNNNFKYYLLRLSLIAPLLYLFLNLDLLNKLLMIDIYILIISLLIIRLVFKNFKFNYFKHYLNILVNPLYDGGGETF